MIRAISWLTDKKRLKLTFSTFHTFPNIKTIFEFFILRDIFDFFIFRVYNS